MRGGKGKLDAHDLSMLPDHIRAGMQDDDDSMPVEPENWEAIRIWCAASSQWHYIGGQRIGLKYSEVYALMRIYRVADQVDCFERVRLMESEVLNNA